MFLLSRRAESRGLQGPPQNEPPSSGQSWGWHSWIRERESGHKGSWPEVQSQKGLAVRPRIWAVIFNTPGRSESTRKNVNQNWRVKGKTRSLLCKSRDLVFARRKLWERSRLRISKTQQVPVCFSSICQKWFPRTSRACGASMETGSADNCLCYEIEEGTGAVFKFPFIFLEQFSRLAFELSMLRS